MTTQVQTSTLPVGEFLTTLLEGARDLEPRISEYQFQRSVLSLLENPFGKDVLANYSEIVGELTKPLHVVADNNRDEILFTVPALVQMPSPSMALSKKGITADVFFFHLARDIELGSRTVNDKIYQFMTSITKTPNYLETVIYPIQAILARYNRKMVALPGVDEATKPTTPASNVPATSFIDEYDD